MFAKDELRDDAELRERERSSQVDEIVSSKEELQELKAKTAIDTKYRIKEAKAHAACAKRVFHAQVRTPPPPSENEMSAFLFFFFFVCGMPSCLVKVL